MAPKSITIAGDAPRVLDAIAAYAAERDLTVDRAPLQNGERIRLTAIGAKPLGLNLYPSKGGGCKIVFDQADDPRADAIATLVGGAASAPAKKKSAGTTIEPVIPGAAAWIGSDESGKGDYFGPLVVAAVGVTAQQWPVLAELGVQDSKNLTDARAAAIAPQIAAAFPSEVITVMPQRYNELYAKFRNVNRLLAWAHARAIENVAERMPDATAAVADQFGDESLIRNALFEKGRALDLVQLPRAERDPAVAAASLLARAEFLRRLEKLSRQAGLRLPKGASAAVDNTARTIAASRGRDALSSLAKLHFRTTAKVVG
jgi:ribonuclease HIII